MPSNTTSSVFFYVYVLESIKDSKRYIGFTKNLRKRIEEHQKGLSSSTKSRVPFKLMYFEGCLNEQDAKRREHYLKGTQGRRFLGLRLQEYTRRKPSNTTSTVAYGDRNEVVEVDILGKQAFGPVESRSSSTGFDSGS